MTRLTDGRLEAVEPKRARKNYFSKERKVVVFIRTRSVAEVRVENMIMNRDFWEIGNSGGEYGGDCKAVFVEWEISASAQRLRAGIVWKVPVDCGWHNLYVSKSLKWVEDEPIN